MASLAQALAPMGAMQDRIAVTNALAASTMSMSSVALKPAGLVIKAGGSPLVKTGAADFYAAVNGTLVRIPTATDMPALTGINISAGQFNVVMFYVDAAGAVVAVPGTAGASFGAVVFPPAPPGRALVGWILINATGAFTGGTTALDAVTTVYFDGNSFNPSAPV